MSDERVMTYESPDSGRTTSLIREQPSSGSGSSIWIFGIVLLIAVLAAVYLLATRSANETVRNYAIANAAEQVGDAAQQVGNAAQAAADNLTAK